MVESAAEAEGGEEFGGVVDVDSAVEAVVRVGGGDGLGGLDGDLEAGVDVLRFP